ncbi:MAG: hypothetical protein M3441_01675 [Chloroflexota bacterium]|nr:hypothetical protein [Chloroflexota bacterium]
MVDQLAAHTWPGEHIQGPDSDDVTTDQLPLGLILLEGVRSIYRHQLPTGEIPSYRRAHRGQLEYRRSPFVSTFVYDALGYFDPRCLWFDPRTLHHISPEWRGWFVQTVERVRRKIRKFVAWQEEAGGRWRFFGRGSGTDPDVDDICCAAAIMLQAPGAGGEERRTRYVNAVFSYRGEGGRFYTYVNRDLRAYSWMDEQGRPIVGFDRVVNANVLRFFGLAGVAADELVAYLLDEARSGDFRVGSPDYPNPLTFFYMMARAWRQADLPDIEGVAAQLVEPLLEMQAEDGSFGGPLSTGMALSALLDLDYTGEALDKARHALLHQMSAPGHWGYEDFFINGFGSPPWTSSLALSCLGRY